MRYGSVCTGIAAEAVTAKLKVLDLFSGIGGFSLGLDRTGGFETVAFCEADPFCRRVLAKHWPGVPIHDDIRTFEPEPADVVCGGFPCQDISLAGKQAGIDGERSGLWSELCRIIGQIRPRYAIVENVPNLLVGPSERPGGWFGRILSDLAAIGFDAEWHCIPASAVGAAFEGDRIWLVATPNSGNGQARMGPIVDRPSSIFAGNHIEFSTASFDVRLETAGRFAGNLDGFSDFVDRAARTRALGNAVVPAVVEQIGHAILAAEQSPLSSTE